MLHLGDICKKRRKLFRLSKNHTTSYCSTDSPVGPIVSGVPRIDAQFNGAYYIKRCLFLYDASFRRYLQKTEKIISSFKNDITSNCCTDSPVTQIVSGVPPIDA